MVVSVVDKGSVWNFRLVSRTLAVGGRLEVDLVLFHLDLIHFLRWTT